MSNGIVFFLVVPANAGSQFLAVKALDPGFRRDDE